VLAVVFAAVNAPLLATVLLGVFWKRATGHGAFAGLLAGLVAAIGHMELTLPVGAVRGWEGGWISVVHRYPSALTQSFWTAAIAFGANLLVTVAVSLGTEAKAENELTGLVHGLTEVEKKAAIWWMRPESLATVVLVVALVVSVLVG
jgi:solute:Na+ symporter, SSS family